MVHAPWAQDPRRRFVHRGRPASSTGARPRTVAVGAGPPTYLQLAQNYSGGWVAAFHGRTLEPVRLDGWEQGWILPGGAAGTVTMTFTPDAPYRVGLAIGALLLVVLALLALIRGGRPELEAVGPRRRLPRWALAAGALVVGVAVAGWVALALVPLVVAARRWGTDVMAVVAGLGATAAGVMVALDPNTNPALSAGAFGAPAQIASLIALGAVLATVVVEDGRAGPRRRAQGEPGPVPSE